MAIMPDLTRAPRPEYFEQYEAYQYAFTAWVVEQALGVLEDRFIGRIETLAARIAVLEEHLF